ncbi:unnamed protein product, partial [Rotaria sp. Silwood2]
MTSHSVSDLNIDDVHRLQLSNDNVTVSELDNMLSSNLNNVLDPQLDHDLKEDANLNKKSENHAITPRSSSTSNLHLVNSSLPSVRRPLSVDESDDGFRVVKNKKKQKQIARDDPQTLNDIEASRINTIAPNLVDVELDQNSTRIVNDNQHQLSSHNFVITNESTRFAQTRYPFPPFVLRFGAGKVTSNQLKENLIDHCKKIHQFDVQVINCRLSSNVLSDNEYDILIYVKDAFSFSFLLEQAHWPKVIGGKSYFFPSAPAIPPQLCLLIKNVDLRIDFDEFCLDIKSNYPQVKNIIRMKNKFQNDIKMVKIELTSPSIRDDLLNKKRIFVNYITYDIIEYLAPANVLICSKCMAIGHFKKQCSQIKETCRICGEQVDDMKNHKCSKIEKCIHCGQNHKSSSLKCPVVKSFRAELTRKILHLNNHSPSDTNLMNKNIIFNSTNFPPPPPPKSSTLSINPMMVKLDELINKLSEVMIHLANLEAKHDNFEQFILEKNRNDEIVTKKLNDLSNEHMNLKKNVVQHSSYIDRHENLFFKLLIPMFEDLFSLIAAQNLDKRGKPLDVDLKCKLNRYLVQMKKATEAKAKASLSSFDFNLFLEILTEWEGSIFLDSCFSLWQKYVPLDENSFHSSLHILSFNVRGLELRWQEVLLLTSSFNFDILILLETENKHGGVLVLVKLDIQVMRIECKLPNVCVLDIAGEEILRIIGVYAPENQDGKKAELFLVWADANFLAPFTPETSTSLRSNRVIDFAVAAGLSIDIQSYSVKPHPYTDSPPIEYDNVDESIPEVTLDELVFTVQAKQAWLLDRRCFIEINNDKSRWFSIGKGGPQGSVLTPTLFISYHCDMGQFLSQCTSHFFADDVAAILAGHLGVRYTSQCIDLEKRIKSFLDSLEYYSCLADQPLNRTKTKAMFSARAIGSPNFNITFDSGDDR